MLTESEELLHEFMYGVGWPEVNLGESRGYSKEDGQYFHDFENGFTVYNSTNDFRVMMLNNKLCLIEPNKAYIYQNGDI